MTKLDRNFALILVSMLLLWGCSGARLMLPTPKVHLNADQDSYHNLAEELKSTEVKLFYITDRSPEQDDEGKLRYGYGRSASLAFGTAVVDLGVDITWEDLLQASRTKQRSKPVILALRQVNEHARGPHSPIPYAMVGDQIVEEPTMLAEREQAVQTFRRMLVQRLALTPRKEVFIYVHGYNNHFDDAAFAMAELWHFFGRIGVPVIYTWPSGYPGMFGYNYDRESSEFTVYHLREILGLIASFPEVDKIHVIAHSRGTDVAVAALRELTIATRAAGINPRLKFKIHNFILAAPYLDIMVNEQRMDGDKLPLSVKRYTIYTSPDDRAIGIAGKLFRSPGGRIGTFSPGDMTEYQRDMAKFYNASDFSIIKFSGASNSEGSQRDRYGHSYFRNAPTVSSDLVLMVQDDIDPGTPGRPLEHIDSNFWGIPPDYHSETSNE